MDTKYIKILKLLSENNVLTSKDLALKSECSVRSIKNYIKDINSIYGDIIESSRVGYSVNKEKVFNILKEHQEDIPNTSKDRVRFIILRVIKQQDETTDIYDLCDELYVSLSTLKNDLVKVKKLITKFDLEIINQDDKLYCKGLEKNKRKLLSSILYDESNNNFVSIESLQTSFPNIDINYIKNTILDVFSNYHYYINDYSLVNLVLHITIAIDRIKNNITSKQKANNLPNIRYHEYELTKTITSRLEERFHVVFDEYEIYEMTLLLLSRATTIDYNSLNKDNLIDFIGNDCLNLVNALIEQINSYFYIDLKEPEFFIRFALHIRNLLIRTQTNYMSKNPLTKSIKSSCPLIYDAAVNMANQIKKTTSITINDDEIAYIAFHIGSTLEAQRSYSSKIQAILFCPSYYDNKLKLTNAIDEYFKNDLIIQNIITNEDDIKNIRGMDLLISTLPLSKIYNFETVVINPFNFSREVQKLSNKINEIKKNKSRKEFENYLRQMITVELFEKNNYLFDFKKCIEYMSYKFEKYGYVNPQFKDDVFDREQMSSTAFGNFAIPHTMKMNAKKTGLNIIISNEPIAWQNNNVNLVIMMCFNKNERYVFNEIYEPITMILSNHNNVEKVLETQDYEDFINTMVNLLEY